jgi:ATP-dependent Clp endopeptidase proteolytic subunit ClpP
MVKEREKGKEKEQEKTDSVEKSMKRLMIGSEMEEQFLKRRQIFLWGEISDDTAEAIVKRILYFDGQSDDDITLYINSPGGVISAGLAIYDAMQKAKSDIATVCMGQAASMGALILCAGTKGKRRGSMPACSSTSRSFPATCSARRPTSRYRPRRCCMCATT